MFRDHARDSATMGRLRARGRLDCFPARATEAQGGRRFLRAARNCERLLRGKPDVPQSTKRFFFPKARASPPPRRFRRAGNSAARRAAGTGNHNSACAGNHRGLRTGISCAARAARNANGGLRGARRAASRLDPAAGNSLEPCRSAAGSLARRILGRAGRRRLPHQRRFCSPRRRRLAAGGGDGAAAARTASAARSVCRHYLPAPSPGFPPRPRPRMRRARFYRRRPRS